MEHPVARLTKETPEQKAAREAQVATVQAGLGGNSGVNETLFSFVERFERLAEEKASLGEDMKEVMGEAKAHGFDTKTLRQVISRRKMDTATRDEMDAMLELYEGAITAAEKAAFKKSVAEGN
jgi:uncharacterized protein (UPF0335 family)